MWRIPQPEVLLGNKSRLECKQHTLSSWIAWLLFVAKPGTPHWKNCSAASRPKVLPAGVEPSLGPVPWVLKAAGSQQAKAVTLLHDLWPGLAGLTLPGGKCSCCLQAGELRRKWGRWEQTTSCLLVVQSMFRTTVKCHLLPLFDFFFLIFIFFGLVTTPVEIP